MPSARNGQEIIAQPATLHQRLKRSTREAHLRVERWFDLEAMTRSPAAYLQCLMVLELSLSAALRALCAIDWATWHPDLARLETRHAWLLEDLRALDAQPSLPSAHLQLGSLGEGIGCLYVLEGSALGGLVIYKAAHLSLGVTPDKGGRYFQGLGRCTLADWKIFLSTLNALPGLTELGDQAEAGALRTFEFIEDAARFSAGDAGRQQLAVAPKS